MHVNTFIATIFIMNKIQFNPTTQTHQMCFLNKIFAAIEISNNNNNNNKLCDKK